jgi:hypothetical protein
MLGMGKPVHIFQLEQVWKKWLIWLPLLVVDAQEKQKKKISTVLNKSTLFNRECFYNINNLYLDKYKSIK